MVATLSIAPANVLTREPRGAALALLYDRSPEILIEGPGGTGKTLGALTKVHICLAKYPGSRALMVRKTRESQTESNLVELEDRIFIGPAERIKRGPDRAHRQRYTYPNGSTWVIGGMNKSSRIMSTQYDIIYVPEATELSEGDWEDLSTRNRHGVMPYQQMIADCNPDKLSHWLNLRANAGLMTRLHSRHEDNPKWYDAARQEWTQAGRDYVLGTLERLTGARKQRMRYGKWATAEGVIFDGYDADRHLIDRFPIPADWRRFRVTDFGFTNPFVTQWWALDPDGRMYRYKELYRTQTLVSAHAEVIERESAGESYAANIADHDAEDRATLAAAGIKTIPAFKAVGVGIQAVQARLAPAADGKPRLFLLRDSLIGRDERLVEAKKPLCTEQEIDGYVWEKSADGRPVKEAPVKVDDHGCFVAGTMVETVNGPRPIESIVPGDLVLTRQGYRPVLASGCTNSSAAVMALRTSDGRTLIGTASHPVYRACDGRGEFVRMDTMRYNDTLLDSRENAAWKSNRSPQNGLTLSACASMASSIAATLLRKACRIVTTTAVAWLTNCAASVCSIVTFGHFTTARYRSGGKCITAISIRSTMTLATWKRCLPLITAPNTSRTVANVRPLLTRHWRECNKGLPAGTAQTKGGGGTANTLAKYTTIFRLLKNSAINAASNTRPTSGARVPHGFARLPAKQSGDATPDSITRIGFARIVAASLCAVALALCATVRVLASVSSPGNGKSGGASTAAPPSRYALPSASGTVPLRVHTLTALPDRVPVYNLTVDAPVGEYYANGILVHNCDCLRYAVAWADGLGVRRTWAV